MITEDYVSFEVAKLLKEKGFDLFLTFGWSDSDKNPRLFIEDEGRGGWYDTKNKWISCPTHQMAMKWLREIHSIFIYIEPFITTSGLQEYKPYCTKIGGEFMWINPLRKYSNTSSDTYEQAVEAALKYCLEKLI